MPPLASATGAPATAAAAHDGGSQASARTADFTRVVLVDKATFDWLRRLQDKTPAPRLEMRYWVEGLLRLMQANRPLQVRWLMASRCALSQHARLQAFDDGDTPDLSSLDSLEQATRPGLLDQSDASWTAAPHGRGEGVVHNGAARTSGYPRQSAPMRNPDCRALHVGESAFLWLKGVQDTTHDPRIDFRFLLQGAFALLRTDGALVADVISAARAALMEHLARSSQLPLALNLSEIDL
ncbi:MAG: hypothetical protein KIT17_05455 [Rubrivivax sp.]|nr:hypothetical protein [Rubrivivax sp.]